MESKETVKAEEKKTLETMSKNQKEIEQIQKEYEENVNLFTIEKKVK